MSFLKKLFGAQPEEHPAKQIAEELNDYARRHYEIGNHKEADELFLQGLDVIRTSFGEDHSEFADSLNNLANFYASNGANDKAKPLFRQAQEITGSALEKSTLPPTFSENKHNNLSEGDPDLVDSLHAQARFYYEKGEFDKVEPLFCQALEIRGRALGKEHPDYIRNLEQFAQFLFIERENFDEAEVMYRQAVKIKCNVLGEDHPDYIQSLNNLAIFYTEKGEFPKAEPLFHQALEIRRVALGEDHPDYANGLFDLAAYYMESAKYIQATSLYRQCIEIQRNTIGENHPDFIKSLHNLGSLYSDIGDFEMAGPLLHQVVEICRTGQSEDHPIFAKSLQNLALYYDRVGEYDQANSLYLQTLEIQRNTIGEDHSDFARTLHNLAAMYTKMGEYTQAEPLYRQAMEIRRRTLGEAHLEYANSLTTFAKFCILQSDLVQAMDFFVQASHVIHNTVGIEHPLYAQSLKNHVWLFLAAGEYENAEKHLLMASGIERKTIGKDHPDFASTLQQLGHLYRYMGKIDAAEEYFYEAMKIRQVALGEDHIEFASSFADLAGVYKDKGEYKEAEKMYRDAIKIIRNSLGEEHPTIADRLIDLAIVFVNTNRGEEAFELLVQAAMIRDKTIGQILTVSSENQRMNYLNVIQLNTYRIFSLLSQHLSKQPEAIQIGLDLLLRRKALGAEVLAVQRDAIMSGRYPEREPQLRQLTGLRRQIAEKTLAGPGADGLEKHQQLLDEWNNRRMSMEIDLAKQIPEINLTNALQSVNWQTIREALPDQTALVEFVRFDIVDFKSTPTIFEEDSQVPPARYLAFVLHAGKRNQISMIDLGEAEPIEQMIATFRTTITGEAENRGLFYGDEEAANNVSSMEIGQNLRIALFEPLLPSLSNYQRIFLSPDGALSRLPFEILPTADGQRLIDKYKISYISTARDILRFGTASSFRPTQPIVIADPDFDLVAEKTSKNNATNSSDIKHPKGHRSQDINRGNIHFSRLPGTRLEGEQVTKLLKMSTISLFDKEALESRLKRYASPYILHIATHGFFLPDQKQNFNKQQLDLMAFDNVSAVSQLDHKSQDLENPLLRSGLALAGANSWNNGGELPVDAEDALLTAEDVSGMDLLATELVVLSACDTGLGEIRAGEGVFGLRRAFVLAGAKTLVMSLWKVPDKQTQELMVDFYKHVLDGVPRAEALRQAQLSMKQKHVNPLYWGAFICQGDPGPLPKDPNI